MSQNSIVSNIAETVGEAAKQGANNALQNLATNNNIVQTAIAGAHDGINQLTTAVTFTPPVFSATTTAPNRVTFSGNGNPVTDSSTTTATLAPGPRDSNNRLYVFNSQSSTPSINFAPPGGNDDANAIALQLAAETPTGDPVQDAILYGPEALRQRAVIPLSVTIPLNSGNIAKGVDDGIKPQASPAPIIYGRRVEKEDGGGWPAGRIIEDRSLYGPQGDLARDTIPASVVSAIVGDNPTGSAGWFVRIALALALLILILYIIKHVIDEAMKKKEMQNAIVKDSDKQIAV